MQDDFLLESARVYSELTQVKFRLVLGKKSRTYTIMLTFPKDGYHHLAGFQYAKGVAALDNKRESLNKVLSGAVPGALLRKAGCHETIEGRCRAICAIPQMMRENRFVFHYRSAGPEWSRIKAKYLLTHDMGDGMIHLFMNGEDLCLSPASAFIARESLYTRNCSRMTTLEIVQILGAQEVCVYRAPTYRME